MLSKDVENQSCPVDDLDLDDLLQRRELRRRQLTVADDGVGAGRQDYFAQFLRLAGTDVGGSVGFVATLNQSFEDLGAGRLGKCGQLGHARLGLLGSSLRPDADQDNSFESKLAVLDFGDVLELGRQTGHAAQGAAICELHLTGRRVARCGRCRVFGLRVLGLLVSGGLFVFMCVRHTGSMVPRNLATVHPYFLQAYFPRAISHKRLPPGIADRPVRHQNRGPPQRPFAAFDGDLYLAA